MARIGQLLEPLFLDYNKEMTPASETQIAEFRKNAREHGMPDSAVEQLAGFYSLTNGVPCLNGFDFHRVDDEILYEWWGTDGHLWLGSHNGDVLRWANGKFCVGDASNIGFSDNDEYTTLEELLERVMADM